jgi:hypothetical protein
MARGYPGGPTAKRRDAVPLSALIAPVQTRAAGRCSCRYAAKSCAGSGRENR